MPHPAPPSNATRRTRSTSPLRGRCLRRPCERPAAPSVRCIARRPPPIGWPSTMHPGLQGEGLPGGRKWCTPVGGSRGQVRRFGDQCGDDTDPTGGLARVRSARTGTSDRPDLLVPRADIRPSVQDLPVYWWSAIFRHTSRQDAGGPVHDRTTRERLPIRTVAVHHVAPTPHIAPAGCVCGEGMRRFPTPPLPCLHFPTPPLPCSDILPTSRLSGILTVSSAVAPSSGDRPTALPVRGQSAVPRYWWRVHTRRTARTGFGPEAYGCPIREFANSRCFTWNIHPECLT